MPIETKCLEIRDRNTFITAIATRIAPHEVDDARAAYLMRRAGYGDPLVLLTHLSGGKQAHCDPFEWRDRTWHVAHNHIERNWQALSNGDVVDVEFILGETKEKKVSERFAGGG